MPEYVTVDVYRKTTVGNKVIFGGRRVMKLEHAEEIEKQGSGNIVESSREKKPDEQPTEAPIEAKATKSTKDK